MHSDQIRNNHEIGATIRKRRRELNFSQEKLAEILCVSTQQVQRYESGKDRVAVEKLQVIAIAFSVPISYFFSHGMSEELMHVDEHERDLLIGYRQIRHKETKVLIAELLKRMIKIENDLTSR